MKAIVPDIPDNLIKKVYELSLYLDKINYIPNETNVRISQWVLVYVIPPKVFLYVGFLYQRRALVKGILCVNSFRFPISSKISFIGESVSSDGVVLSYKVTVVRCLKRSAINLLNIIHLNQSLRKLITWLS